MPGRRALPRTPRRTRVHCRMEGLAERGSGAADERGTDCGGVSPQCASRSTSLRGYRRSAPDAHHRDRSGTCRATGSTARDVRETVGRVLLPHAKGNARCEGYVERLRGVVNGTVPVTDLVRALDLTGVFANAVLGGVIARREKLDPVGFAVLALLSGLGGGLIRDVLLQTGHPGRVDRLCLPADRVRWCGAGVPGSGRGADVGPGVAGDRCACAGLLGRGRCAEDPRRRARVAARRAAGHDHRGRRRRGARHRAAPGARPSSAATPCTPPCAAAASAVWSSSTTTATRPPARWQRWWSAPGCAWWPAGAAGSCPAAMPGRPRGSCPARYRIRHRAAQLWTDDTDAEATTSTRTAHESPSRRPHSVLAGLDQVRGWQEDFYRHLHQHPELSHQEQQPQRRWPTRLRDCGYDVHEQRRRDRRGGGSCATATVRRCCCAPTWTRCRCASRPGCPTPARSPPPTRTATRCR